MLRLIVPISSCQEEFDRARSALWDKILERYGVNDKDLVPIEIFENAWKFEFKSQIIVEEGFPDRLLFRSENDYMYFLVMWTI